LAIRHLPTNFQNLCGWSKSPDDFGEKMQQRARDLAELLGSNLQMAEGVSDGPMSFSPAVPHGTKGSKRGTVMMTRIDLGNKVFLHTSDIQLLDAATVDFIIAWQPDIVLAAGPPLYIETLPDEQRTLAWENGLRLAATVDILILDHHLMRDQQGLKWLDDLSAEVGKQVYCAADFMGRKRLLLEAGRTKLYETMPVPAHWHEEYAKGSFSAEDFMSTGNFSLS
jgi:predicted metallo-beta-lactamase superfamily hydrolase